MDKISYHIFMFPFQWHINGYEDKVFSEQINLNNIDFAKGSNWERISTPVNEEDADVLYNERNYFYKFVHDALYDKGEVDSLIRHYERNEPKHSDVVYVIDCGAKQYELKVEAINLNLYSTGVGLLSFHLSNNRYTEAKDVFRINQAGRRVFPPYIASVQFRGIIAHSLELKGLQGRETGYREDFEHYTNKTASNKPASFIEDMIHEVAKNIDMNPVIDDRMFVQCWYKNNQWADDFSGDKYEDFLYSSQWYEFIFVDDLGEMSCQNEEMQKEIIKRATYERWQKSKSLYGISRYSMMCLTNQECPDFLLTNFESMYARMSELILVEKASVLRFSDEVTKLGNMEVKRNFTKKVSSLYKEYIRFLNQIHFREISAQDQGIEMYQKLYDAMNIGKQVDKLDEDIEELYNYVSLNEDRDTNNTMSLLTWIATIAVPMTVVAAFFGTNNMAFKEDRYLVGIQLLVALVVTIIVIIGILTIKNRRSK